jgi:hypothetical protein
MLAGSEYLTSNTDIAYPFVEDAAGLIYAEPGIVGVSALLPANCFVDAVFAVPHSTQAVYLSQIVGLVSMTGHWRRFVFYLAGTPSPSLYQFDFNAMDLDLNNYFTRIEVGAEHYLTGALLPMKFTVVTATLYKYLLDAAWFPHNVAEFQDRLRFESRTAFLGPQRIETLELYQALPPSPEPDVAGPITGDVRLISGYNISQIVSGDSLSLSATPGTGDGLAPCQQPVPVIYKQFMATTPDDAGNVQLVAGGDQCYTIVPHTDDSFEIQGTCTACCSCQDYANITKALENLFNRAKAVYDRLERTRLDTTKGFEVGVTKFNADIFPQYGKPVLMVNGMGGQEWQIEGRVNTGAPHHATFTIAVQNNTSWPMTLTSLDATFVCVPADTPIIRTVVWECHGDGGRLSPTFPITPGFTIPRGVRYSVYVAVRHPLWNVTPAWTVTATAQVHVLHPTAPYDVILGPVVCTIT